MEFKFRPVSHSWVAIHPNPKGVVQFIGGAFFGTFPTIFYRYFLRKLFAEGYTIIALPFRFSFQHWPIAVSLLQEQAILSEEISKIAASLNYQNHIYQDKTKYFWIGHSLGCKYITLLEFLSGDEPENIVEECTENSERQLQAIQKSVERMLAEKPSIKGQPSLLIAPDISDTESAVPQPLAFIARFLDKFGLGVLPTRKQTQCLVENSNLFNLTALISFDKDTIAGSEKDKDIQKSDVLWFIQQLRNKKFPLLHEEIPGKHLEPVGIQIGNYVVDLNPLDKFIEPMASRKLEDLTIQFLDELEQRQQISSSVKSEPSLVSIN
ncbi:DUF1350 family protein [Nostoc sp. FACHB-152]|uniref:DUF1350 family protein n=1 Tax=unclassified Nostoc TaxID=2593658 RepID=UPI001687B575|nr:MULTISPECIES: DUF1350 family protein [unclassified Nostoc]MBD2449101.1 DUF1350 family protein [Nostoc sp. FACHB-152]MBD2472731.1 DUF1350 family protein [Nostoc sp. FACHB-145]